MRTAGPLRTQNKSGRLLVAQTPVHALIAGSCTYTEATALARWTLGRKTRLERGADGAERGALLLKELPPTRPPDLAASASSGSAAPRSREAASVAATGMASLAARGRSSWASWLCFWLLHLAITGTRRLAGRQGTPRRS